MSEVKSPAARSLLDASTVDPLVSSTSSSVLPSLTSAADFATEIGAAISNMDQALERTVTVRAEVGSRLLAIDSAAATREDEAVDLQALLSDLRDVDYAEAISRLNQEYAGLQAAQAAYTRIAQMSLFDYL